MVIKEKRPHLNCKLCEIGFEDPLDKIEPKDKKDVRNIYDINRMKDKVKKKMRRDMKSGKIIVDKVYDGGKKDEEKEECV